jgi:UPF0716 family protein affecting phage T7 exclusion
MMATLTGALAVGKIAQAMRRTVEETVEYGTEVRQVSSITGEGAEATSRMLAVFEDFDVGGQAVTTMLRTLASQGLSPTIETIARLSDKYLALAPGVDRATFLQENFGRSGADLAAVMEQGSAALLARNAGVERGLVLSQQDLDATEALRQAQDGLSDGMKSIATTIALMFIPGLTTVFKGLTRSITPTRELMAATHELNLRLAKSATTYAEYAQNLRDTADAQGLVIITQERRNEALATGHGLEIEARDGIVQLTDAEWQMAAAGRDMAGGWDEGTRALQGFVGGVGGAGMQIDGLTSSIIGLTTAQLQQNELQALIQTRDIVAAGGGDTRDLDEAINHLAITMGIATPTTIGNMLAYQDLLAEYQRTGDVDAFTAAVQRLIAAQDGLHDVDVTYTAHVRQDGQWVQHPGMDDEFQHGGAFEVGGPSGTDQAPVAFMATRGERVEVTPAGEQTRGPQYPVTFNVYVNNRDDLQALEQSVMQIFRGV